MRCAHRFSFLHHGATAERRNTFLCDALNPWLRSFVTCRPKPRTMARLLNPAQEQRLVTFFEQLCADRANMARLMAQMGGRCGRLL